MMIITERNCNSLKIKPTDRIIDNLQGDIASSSHGANAVQTVIDGLLEQRKSASVYAANEALGRDAPLDLRSASKMLNTKTTTISNWRSEQNNLPPMRPITKW